VSADVYNREAVFRLPREVRLLREVLCGARGIYEFEVRELCVEADRVSFCVNAADEVAVIYTPQSETAYTKAVPVLKNLKKSTFFTIF
jgi:hypothetical protein